MLRTISHDKELLAYVVGLALGDGNLSNPSGRGVRLRITCDIKYPNLIQKIKNAIEILLPENKTSIVHRQSNCVDISCYSNKWEKLLGWRVGKGSKFKQEASVPGWIKRKTIYKIKCLRGLIETDGSVYLDRGYPMVMFVTIIPKLADDVYKIINSLGFKANVYKLKPKASAKYSYKRQILYHIRVSKNVQDFINLVGIEKS